MAKKAAEPKSFDTALAELESLVSEMESGRLSIEDALERYQRGAALLGFCQERLAGIEQRVQVLEDGLLRELPDADDANASET